MLQRLVFLPILVCVCWMTSPVAASQDWPQAKFDARRSGNVPGRHVELPLRLRGAVPATDAILTSPAVAEGKVFVVDASGVLFCIDTDTLHVDWRFASAGGLANCNNVSSPAVIGPYVHFGTMAGIYYVLRRDSGEVVAQLRCGEPIFSAPAISNNRAYFATLGSKVYAVEPDGIVAWTWDYVREQLDFAGDRWDGSDWLEAREGRVTWRDQFCCMQDVAMHDKRLVVPTGGVNVWLEDTGPAAHLAGIGVIPSCAGRESPATFGMSIGEDGSVYRQWHRRDNTGRLEILRLKAEEVETSFVPGTQAAVNRPESLGFSSASLRGADVYRCRPEEGFGFCLHNAEHEVRPLGGYPSIASPILAGEHGIFGGLDGRLFVVPLSGDGEGWSFRTAFGRPITAPVAVSEGRIYVGCEDGYLYVLGPEGEASLPEKDLDLHRIRSPLSSPKADAKFDWFTNFGDLQSTNANNQGIGPPFRIKWIRRYPGTFKHLPVCGGGRMYTHTAEGQVFAVEQETGRLLWRKFYPGVHASFTAPIYCDGRLIVPQAGLGRSRMRCFDAATGRLLWEAPFSGSPSWSRQMPPIVYKGLVIYCFGTGRHTAKGSDEVLRWLYSHDNPDYPSDHRPLVRAWDLDTGREVWTRDFSNLGTGGDDAGLCLMDDTLYYSCFFGYAAKDRTGQPGPRGITTALNPATGATIWQTTDYSVTAGTTISCEPGRLYLGGYNAPASKDGPRYVWCLDAAEGSLLWRSEPLIKSINVVTVGSRFLFTHAYGRDSVLLDKQTGRILSTFNYKYACTRFTLSEPYILGPNMDLIDTSQANRLVSTGPPVDARDCVGGVVSNGRLFYTSQASGLQVSKVCGEEARTRPPVWEAVGDQ